MLGGRPPYLWLRDLHLLCGLFASPFLLLFAITTLLLNHPSAPPPNAAPGQPSAVERSVTVPTGLSDIDQARQILRQVGVTGEVQYLGRDGDRLEIPVARPGERTTVRVDLATGRATVERRPTGFGERLTYLHRAPGPHVADIRGNWIYTRLWRWLVDALVCLVLLISASGVYLWSVLRAERRTGLVLLGLGTVAFAALVWVLVR
ncbi:MAG: PepSY-associated TM helix domain-containing protein [Candidatus Latescibacterota bacterium]